MSFDGDHFGIYTVGEVTMYLFKITCFATPAETAIDDFNLDIFSLQIYECHQSKPWRKYWSDFYQKFFKADLLKATEGILRCLSAVQRIRTPSAVKSLMKCHCRIW